MEYYKNLSLEDLFYINDDGLICHEEWKDIPNYSGMYKASNLGRLKSLYFGRKIILKQNLNNKGYFKVNLYLNRKIKSVEVHQLMAITFLNHIPCSFELVVDHIDTNKWNNCLSNFRIVPNRVNCNQKHIKSLSDFVGVSWHKRDEKWVSQIRINGKTKHLGYFNYEEEASQCYENAVYCYNNNLPIKTNSRQNYSNYRGVYWVKSKNKWKSEIRINGKLKYLGSFYQEIEAHNAYQNALKTAS